MCFYIINETICQTLFEKRKSFPHKQGKPACGGGRRKPLPPASFVHFSLLRYSVVNQYFRK